MKKSNNKITTLSFGSFSLFKGLGMILIVACHTIGVFGSFPTVITSAFMFKEIINASFFIVSGYAFRTKENRKCIKQQFKFLFKPYIVVTLITSALHLVVHYLTFRWFPGSLKETIKLLIGFLIGTPATIEVMGEYIYASGPIWFLLTLTLSWILLNLIMNTKIKNKTFLVLLVSTLGWLIGLIGYLPFCIPQSMVAVAYLYTGYKIRELDIFKNNISFKQMFVFVISILLIIIPSLYFQVTNSMIDNNWILGPISIVSNIVPAYLLIRFFIKIKQDRFKLSFIKRLGNNSFIFLCVHTVEFNALPWYRYAEKFNNVYFGCFTLIIIRLVIDIAITEIVIKRKSLLNKAKNFNKHTNT